jgi:hypothetical protein
MLRTRSARIVATLVWEQRGAARGRVGHTTGVVLTRVHDLVPRLRRAMRCRRDRMRAKADCFDPHRTDDDDRHRTDHRGRNRPTCELLSSHGVGWRRRDQNLAPHDGPSNAHAERHRCIRAGKNGAPERAPVRVAAFRSTTAHFASSSAEARDARISGRKRRSPGPASSAYLRRSRSRRRARQDARRSLPISASRCRHRRLVGRESPCRETGS